jgi:hypothetical protein
MAIAASPPFAEDYEAFCAIWRRDVVDLWVNHHGFVQVELRDKGAWHAWPAWFRRTLIRIVHRRYGRNCLWVLRGPSSALLDHPEAPGPD